MSAETLLKADISVSAMRLARALVESTGSVTAALVAIAEAQKGDGDVTGAGLLYSFAVDFSLHEASLTNNDELR